MRSPKERDDWSYAEGLKVLGIFLAGRLPYVLAFWLVPVYFAISPLTHLPSSTLLTILFTVPIGMLTGAPLGYKLIPRTQLVGWVPALAAFGAAALVIVGGTAVVAALRPFADDFSRTLVPVMGLAGAGGAIAKLTLSDS